MEAAPRLASEVTVGDHLFLVMAFAEGKPAYFLFRKRNRTVASVRLGTIAGPSLGGVLYAIQNKFAAPDFVFFLISGETVIFNVMGGIGTLVGMLVGAGIGGVVGERWHSELARWAAVGRGSPDRDQDGRGRAGEAQERQPQRDIEGDRSAGSS